jgi:hypothetical protein
MAMQSTDPGISLPTIEIPTTAQFINAANCTYGRDEADLPADLRAFMVAGEHLTLEITDHGFYGAAFLTPGDQVVIAFEGTHLSALEEQPAFVGAQIAADARIYLGQSPAAYADALIFTQAVIAAAEAQGIGGDDVYLTGHSLGAAEAQYVAAQLDLAGETYGGPGIPADAVPPSAVSRLTNYVERGDPIGNYSADPDVLNGFLFGDDILRFGSPTYLGGLLAGAALEAAGALFGPGTTPAQNAAGLTALAGLADEYHPLATYADDLGVTLDDPGAYGSVGPDAARWFAAAHAVLAGRTIDEPIFA